MTRPRKSSKPKRRKKNVKPESLQDFVKIKQIIPPKIIFEGVDDAVDGQLAGYNAIKTLIP